MTKIYDIDSTNKWDGRLVSATAEQAAQMRSNGEVLREVPVGVAPDGLYGIWLEGHGDGDLYRVRGGRAVYVGLAGDEDGAGVGIEVFRAVIAACEIEGWLDCMVVERIR